MITKIFCDIADLVNFYIMIYSKKFFLRNWIIDIKTIIFVAHKFLQNLIIIKKI